jgi:hypothetical protein
VEPFSFTEIFEFFSLYLHQVTRPKRRYGGDAALTWETEEGVRPPTSAFKFPIPSPLSPPLPSWSVPHRIRIPSCSRKRVASRPICRLELKRGSRLHLTAVPSLRSTGREHARIRECCE